MYVADVVALPAVSVATTCQERVPVVAAKLHVYCPAAVCEQVVPEGGDPQSTATVPDDSTHSRTTSAMPAVDVTSATSAIVASPPTVAPLAGETSVTFGPPAPPSGVEPPPPPASTGGGAPPSDCEPPPPRMAVAFGVPTPVGPS